MLKPRKSYASGNELVTLILTHRVVMRMNRVLCVWVRVCEVLRIASTLSTYSVGLNHHYYLSRNIPLLQRLDGDI
jgi:hypothetical protein